MLIPGIQLESETESIISSKNCLELFDPLEQDVYVVSHSPDGAFQLRIAKREHLLILIFTVSFWNSALSRSHAFCWANT